MQAKTNKPTRGRAPSHPPYHPDESLWDKLSRLVELRVELVATQLKNGAAQSVSTVASWLPAALFGYLFILFGGIAGGLGIGRALDNYALGFLVMCGLFGLVTLAIVLLNKQLARYVQGRVEEGIDRLARAGLDDLDMDDAANLARVDPQYREATVRAEANNDDDDKNETGGSANRDSADRDPFRTRSASEGFDRSNAHVTHPVAAPPRDSPHPDDAGRIRAEDHRNGNGSVPPPSAHTPSPTYR